MTSRPNIIEFRALYKRERIPSFYSGWLHLGFTAFACLAIIFWCASQLSSVTFFEWLTLPATFLYANLSEYLGHRGPMHHPVRGLRTIYRRHSREHHIFFTAENMIARDADDFTAVLFPPILLLFFTAAFALPVGVLLAWLTSANVAYLFGLMSLAYFLNYELLHLAYHLPETSWVYKIPFVKELRKHHTVHHRLELMSQYNFNITYPIADWLFGTVYRRVE